MREEARGCLTLVAPEAVCEAQHVFTLWRGLSSLFKTKKKKLAREGEREAEREGGRGCEGKHGQENLTKRLRMFPSDKTLCFSFITYASPSNRSARHAPRDLDF